MASVLLGLPLLLLLHDPTNVGHKVKKQLLRRLNIGIDCLDEGKELLSVSRHVVDVLLADSPKFVADVPLSDDVRGGFVAGVFHALVEGISLEEASD